MTAPTTQASEATPVPIVTCTIDGVQVSVPKGTLVIRAAEQIGIAIPRFCDHPLLAPAGACRQCLVDVAMPGPDGTLRPMPKPQASCTLEVGAGMVVNTQLTSAAAAKAQHGVMEFLLINHPLDCPVCDKGGECPLQNQAMSNGRATSRFTEIKRTFPKPVKISTQVLLDRDRCILCQRCTRFSSQIAGDPFIDLQMRGARQQIGVFDEAVLGFGGAALPEEDMVGPGGRAGLAAVATPPVGVAETDTSGRPFASYFSGNTIQICPVGALTSAAYRFRSRPFDLVSTPGIAEHDACGSAIRVDHRRGVVLRRLAGEDPAVNEEWLTDKDRFAFAWQSAPDRLTAPLIRDPRTGDLVEASWGEAIEAAARGLAAARAAGGVGLLPGGRLTLEDAYAWSKFARVALGTNDVDFRARAGSSEEEAYLGARVAGTGIGVTYADLGAAPFVLLVGLEPEEEAGAIFLRLRKGVLARRVRVATLAPFASRGTVKLRADLVAAAPGTEAEVLDAVGAPGRGGGALGEQLRALGEALAAPGAVVLAGERLAAVPGAFSSLDRLAARTGARVAWVPRRAGDRGAVEAGLLPGLLPGGRPVADDGARADLAHAWGVPHLPATAGRDLPGILAAAAAGALGALVVGGVDLEDLPDPAAAERALAAAPFVVQLEVRSSAVTQYADVVLPVAPPVEKAGTFLNWEGRRRPFPQALASRALPDRGVLGHLAAELGAPLDLASLEAVHAELGRLAGWRGPRLAAPADDAGEPALPAEGQAVLATWRLLLDSGRLQDGEPHLAGTAPRPVARLSAATAAAVGVADGDRLTVTGPAGWLTLHVVVTDMVDHVVWVPQHSPGSWVNRGLGVGPGGLVSLTPAEVVTPAPEIAPAEVGR